MKDQPDIAYCEARRDLRGLEVWEDGVRTTHVEHAFALCVLEPGHAGKHAYGTWRDPDTMDPVELWQSSVRSR